MASHDEDAPRRGHHPANRLGFDYRVVPPRRLLDCPILDMHLHIRVSRTTDVYFEAADLYGIGPMVTMSPLDEVDRLRETYGERLDLIAVPRFREFEATDAFRERWLEDLRAFRERGARVMKFWMAPPMRGDHGLTLEHEFMQPVIDAGLEMGYDFMVHVADPTAWWRAGGKYDDAEKYGTKRDQYPQLEWFLERVFPRFVIAAHMGGSVEEPDLLHELLDRHPNLHIDTSATKWIVRGVAAHPDRVRELIVHHADRVLFGTDLVVADKYDFEHYASRFWAHQTLWETDYRGESGIDDPDTDGAPRLAGVDLPDEVLRKIYWENSRRLGFCAAAANWPTPAAARATDPG